MAKAIKLSNDIYLDSTGIVHNKKKLSNILYEETLLFEGGTRETITLPKSSNDFDYLLITYQMNGSTAERFTKLIDMEQTTGIEYLPIFTHSVEGKIPNNFNTRKITISGTSINFGTEVNLAIYAGTGTMYGSTTEVIQINKIIGFKKSS